PPPPRARPAARPRHRPPPAGRGGHPRGPPPPAGAGAAGRGSVAPRGDPIPPGNRLELFLGAAIGAITFSGSVIAFGKLSGKYKFRLFQGTPVQFSGQHLLNLVLGLATLGLG
ncbi:NAD(P)(+) transhydrogenase (Re/Si-specific) subunit beta, partial [Pseudomonas aeruginosa]|uniref:NAD(P)(+) transhydrogenase (Re/Si-specific) subunit beta n=1 Tax=Pseudomonas aeruginosa TaxID=287 RepID=UPI0024AFE4EE